MCPKRNARENAGSSFRSDFFRIGFIYANHLEPHNPGLWPGPPPARRCRFPQVSITRLRYVLRRQYSPHRTHRAGPATRPGVTGTQQPLTQTKSLFLLSSMLNKACFRKSTFRFLPTIAGFRTWKILYQQRVSIVHGHKPEPAPATCGHHRSRFMDAHLEVQKFNPHTFAPKPSAAANPVLNSINPAVQGFGGSMYRSATHWRSGFF
jgi:hypothetical protein